MNFKIGNLPAFRLPASQPAVRPGSASATALEFLHNKGTIHGKILEGEYFGELMTQKSLARKNLANLLVVY